MVICLMVLKYMLKEDSKNVLVLMESELTRMLKKLSRPKV